MCQRAMGFAWSRGFAGFNAKAQSRVSDSELYEMATPILLGRNAMKSKVAKGRGAGVLGSDAEKRKNGKAETRESGITAEHWRPCAVSLRGAE